MWSCCLLTHTSCEKTQKSSAPMKGVSGGRRVVAVVWSCVTLSRPVCSLSSKVSKESSPLLPAQRQRQTTTTTTTKGCNDRQQRRTQTNAKRSKTKQSNDDDNDATTNDERRTAAEVRNSFNKSALLRLPSQKSQLRAIL